MATYDSLDFTPSADGTLDNMKYGGIDVSECVQELKDNCDDAGSKKTDVFLLPKDSADPKLAEFLIRDTGRGMNEKRLLNAMKLAHRHEHTDADIGKFGVGLKNATMGLGDQITIVTKTVETSAIGIFMNIPDMRRQNTFKPTQYEPDASALRGQFPSEIWQAFCSSSSGTLISVKGIHEHHVHDVAELSANVHRALNFNYSDSDAVTTVRNTVNATDKDLVVKHVDAFYHKNPENLSYSHETELRVYKGKVFEVVTDKRKRGAKNINASPEKPLYFQCNTLAKGGLAHSDTYHQPVNSLPDGAYKSIRVRFIQVTPEAFEKEAESGDWNGFDKRRGFFFLRGKRMVGAAMTLDLMMNDSNNHLRMEVSFDPSLDLEMGVRTQKQMSRSLHSVAISDALRIVWKQLSNARIKERSDEIQKSKVKVDSDSSESSESEDGIAEFIARARRDKAAEAARAPLPATPPPEEAVHAPLPVSDSSPEPEAEEAEEAEDAEDTEEANDSFGSFHDATISEKPVSTEIQYEASNGYLRLMQGSNIVSRVPNANTNALELWLCSVPLPAGKTRVELSKHLAGFWGLE